MTGWYLKIANKEVGPLSSQQLKAMAKQGQLGPEDLIRQGGEGPWIAAGRVRGLLSASVMVASEPPLPTAQSLEDTVEITKAPSQAEATTVIPPNPPKPKPATPKAAIPVGAPLPGNVPSADPVVPVGLPVATPVLAGSVPRPPIVEPPVPCSSTQTVTSAAPASSPAEAKRKRQRQQRVLVFGLVGSLVVLAGVAVIVAVSTSGNPSARSSSERKSNAPPVPTEPQASVATENVDVLDSLKGIETSVLTANAARSSKNADGWIDARKESASFGPVKVKVKAVEVGKARFTRLTETCLAIHLELSNSHETKLQQYTPWRRQPGISLVDEFDNSYALRAVKQTRGGSIYPGKSFDETVFFRPPVAKSKSLRLQLPAAAFNEDGMIRFQIPVSMIQEVEVITGATTGSGDAQPHSDRHELEASETTAADKNPPEREEPHINRAIMEANQEQEPAKPATKKASNLSSLQKEIKNLDGDDMEEEVTDFESDPEALKKIEAMNQQAAPTAVKKKNRRSGGG